MNLIVLKFKHILTKWNENAIKIKYTTHVQSIYQ